MTSPIHFSRTPYKVTYYKDGEKQTINRRPPKLLHEMLPKDVVKLTRGKNDDYAEGDEFTVKHINPRHPNTIQIEDDDGNATFVTHADLNLEERVNSAHPSANIDSPERNQYLLWP